MAISQHGRVTIISLAAVLMLLFAGAAQATTCPAGYKDCDNNYSYNGCEINVLTDVNNCGDCGVKCPACSNAVPYCKAAKCEFTCSAPFKNCDYSWANGCEVDSSKDVSNCGACGTKCTAPPYASAKCYNSKCEYTCNAGWKNCDGRWENGCECAVGTDSNNCGACGVKCKDVANAVTKCVNNKCEYTCKAGWGNCDYNWMNGCECSPDTDVNHCGGCGKKCPEPKYLGGEAKCTNGKCETQSCKKGMKYDGGKKCCVNNDGGKDGGHNSWKDGGRGGGKGGDKGGSKGGDEGGSKGGNKGGNEGGHGGGW